METLGSGRVPMCASQAVPWEGGDSDSVGTNAVLHAPTWNPALGNQV